MGNDLKRHECLTGFPDRLRETIGETSIRAFAAAAGLSEGTLRKYLRNETYPTLDRLVAIAAAGKVDIPWLATGQGLKRAEAQSAVDDEDWQRMSRAVESALKQLHASAAAPATPEEPGIHELWSNENGRYYLLMVKPQN